jgi:cystathionine beta-lyase
MTPIYQTSTFVQSAPGQHKGYAYARTHNPTRSTLEKCIAELEGGKYGFSFGSGMAAIDTAIKLLEPGDEVIVGNDLYGGTYRLFTKVFARFGIHFRFIPLNNPAEVAAAFTEKTRMLWLETPTNPLMNIVDIAALAEVARQHRAITVVDNTFATPYLQNPLALGADIVMHSATKYLGGHSDVVMGLLVTNTDELAQQLAFLQNACGAISGPQDCFLVLRGIKTLHLRMERHCENGRAIADYLQQHERVQKVYWPGLASHANHQLARQQMRNFGGMLSFELKGDNTEEAVQVLQRVRLFALAESLGGVESLCGHPATMTHGSIPPKERKAAGLKDSLIRLSIGVEDAEDLIADLAQALQ